MVDELAALGVGRDRQPARRGRVGRASVRCPMTDGRLHNRQAAYAETPARCGAWRGCASGQLRGAERLRRFGLGSKEETFPRPGPGFWSDAGRKPPSGRSVAAEVKPQA